MKLKLLEPISIGKKLSKNRIAMAPMETRLSTITGDITPGIIDYYEQRAKGGAGIIIVENTYVDNLASRSSLSSSGLYSDHLIAGKNLLAEAIKRNGALALIQLSHGGRQAREGATVYDAAAPSSVICSVMRRVPHVLSRDEIVKIEDAFSDAALRAKMAGFDGVEVHGAHGYLICSFLSPLTNKRNDKYGGSLKNRGRFAENIINKIREKTGPDFIIGYRISASEYIKRGLEIDEACEFTASIQKTIDYIHVSAGIYESPDFWATASTYIPAGQLIPLAFKIKKAVSIPVIAVGSMNPKLAEEVLQNNKADIIAFGRALIADPFLPKKISEDREDDIIPCIRGNEGCLSRFHSGCAIRCEVNPSVGRERDIKLEKALKPRKILVIGGGISGMEAARIASKTGHEVTLVEKEDKLGGHLLESTKQDFKAEEKELFKWLVRQLKKSDIKIILNTEADSNFIKSQGPDVAILATGSQYIRPNIIGADSALLAGEVLDNASLAGRKVIVVGGGLIGAETALTLASMGHEVTLIEMSDKIAENHEPGTRQSLILRLKDANVLILTNHIAEEIKKTSIKVRNEKNEFICLDADTVVLATGLASRKTKDLENSVPEIICIGDCVEPRKIYQCMHEAWDAVLNKINI